MSYNSSRSVPNVGKALILVVVAALFIGIAPSAAKLSYAEGANPIFVLLARSVIGAVGLGLFLGVKGQALGVSRPYVRRTAIAGITFLIAAGTSLASLVYIDVSLASIIWFTHPFFIAVANHFLGNGRLKMPDIMMIFAALLGLGLALGVTFDNLDGRGLALAALCSLALTVMILSVASTSREIGAVRSNLHMTSWAGVYTAIIAATLPTTGLIAPMAFPESAWGWVLVVATAVSFSMGYLLFFVVVGIIGSTRASVLSILEPVLMVLMAVVLVGERLTPVQWAGVVVVLGSLYGMEGIQARRTEPD